MKAKETASDEAREDQWGSFHRQCAEYRKERLVICCTEYTN